MSIVWTELIVEGKKEDVGGSLIEAMTDMEEMIGIASVSAGVSANVSVSFSLEKLTVDS